MSKKDVKKLNEILFYSLIDVSENFEDFKRMPAPEDEKIDSLAWEKVFHQMPQEQLEVFVCLYLGLKPKEIMKVLGFDTIARFYNVNAKLKRLYRELKIDIF
jgi:hypothetical protein